MWKAESIVHLLRQKALEAQLYLSAFVFQVQNRCSLSQVFVDLIAQFTG